MSFFNFSVSGAAPSSKAQLNRDLDALVRGPQKPVVAPVAVKPAAPPAKVQTPGAAPPKGVSPTDWSVYITTMTLIKQGKGDSVHNEWLKTSSAVANHLGQKTRAADLNKVLVARNEAARPKVQVAATPASKPVAKPAAKPVDKQADRIAAKPVARAPQAPVIAAKPAARPVDKGVAKTAAKPVAKSATKPQALTISPAERAAYQATMAALIAGKTVPMTELDAAAITATQLGHKKSLATLERAGVMVTVGVTPAELRTYGTAVNDLRAGNTDEAILQTASLVATKMQVRPDLLGYIPANVRPSDWIAYLNIMARLTPNTPPSVLEVARETAQASGHAKIGRMLATVIARKKSKADVPVAKTQPQRDPRRPFQPPGQWNVSDAEYKNYEFVQKALGASSDKIDPARLKMAHATALKYKHSQTADLIAERASIKPAATMVATQTVKSQAQATAPKVAVSVEKVLPVVTASERALFDSTVRRIRNGEELSPQTYKDAAIIAAKLGKPTTAKEFERQYVLASRAVKKSPAVVASVPVAPKREEIKAAAVKYNVPPAVVARQVVAAKTKPQAQAQVAKAESARRAIEDGTVTSEQVDSLKARAAKDDRSAQAQLATLAAAEASARAIENRAPVASIEVENILPPTPVQAPSRSQVAKASEAMSVPQAATEQVLADAQSDPKAQAAISRGMALMQDAADGDPEARMQMNAIKEAASSRTPQGLAAGAVLAAAGAATIAAKKKPAQAMAVAPKPKPPTALKAQVAPNTSGGGIVGLVIVGVSVAGLGLYAMRK